MDEIKTFKRKEIEFEIGSFDNDKEKELQRLVRKIKYQQPTYDDMEKADALTRKKWKSQGIS